MSVPPEPHIRTHVDRVRVLYRKEGGRNWHFSYDCPSEDLLKLCECLSADTYFEKGTQFTPRWSTYADEHTMHVSSGSHRYTDDENAYLMAHRIRFEYPNTLRPPLNIANACTLGWCLVGFLLCLAASVCVILAVTKCSKIVDAVFGPGADAERSRIFDACVRLNIPVTFLYGSGVAYLCVLFMLATHSFMRRRLEASRESVRKWARDVLATRAKAD